MSLFVFVSYWLLCVFGPDLRASGEDGDAYTLHSQTPPSVQEQTVVEMIQRLIPLRVDEFTIEVNSSVGLPNKDTFQLKSEGSTIHITGTSGVAAAWGFQHYLKYYCSCHVSWSGDQLNIQHPLPPVSPALVITSNDKFRYYQNVCTPSYSMVWWNWTRWERELDWMAMNGINLPLAFTAQESIWWRALVQLGFSDSDIDNFFTGPAFLAWNRMGNVQKWAGPLPKSWHVQRIALQHKILERMRNFGMIPVLPAFSGHVPPATPRVYPNASVTAIRWGSFSPPYSNVYFMDPTDPLFVVFGEAFLKAYIAEFGTDHVYNTDLFNEMTPPSSEPSYLRKCGQAVYKSLTSLDPNAVWVMQGWLFENAAAFWLPAQAEALLTSVPIGRMVVLDLEAEFHPQYTRLQSFYGQPFIWCMIHNFGGVNGLYGAFDALNSGPFEGRNFTNSTMIGTGLAPEGIERNDVMFEFMNEMAWRKESVDLSTWISEYSKRRYGKLSITVSEGWKLLQKSVYNASSSFIDHGRYVLTRRPTLHPPPELWFNSSDVYKSWRLFLASLNDEDLTKQSTFRYDTVDLSREVLQLLIAKYYEDAVTAYSKKDWFQFRNISTAILGILKDLEMLLASDSHFLLGSWLKDAKSFGNNTQESKLYEFNSRNQITLWGPKGEILDYASKQWSGVVSGYYYPRWKLFLHTLEDSLRENIPFDQTKFNNRVLNFVEEQFCYSQEVYPSEPIGNTVKIIQYLWKKYQKDVLS